VIFMSSDNPTLAEVGEENIKARKKREQEQKAESRWFKANEYERL
jgi:hypothetical protein